MTVNVATVDILHSKDMVSYPRLHSRTLLHDILCRRIVQHHLGKKLSLQGLGLSIRNTLRRRPAEGRPEAVPEKARLLKKKMDELKDIES